MLRARMPGPYEDRVGPVVLTILLVLSILVNMVLKFIDIFSAKRTLRSNRHVRCSINRARFALSYICRSSV